ncbi:MAG: sulfotransferase family 2 domain-containing protein [Candidatus Lokiarchaeota archaeon]|nr:sulfotransferase family 2 domain-containing protein [Candidatus Lokiarchaeota archaeon]
MIILPKYEPFHTRVIFYRIPKNASTSVYEHLSIFNVIKENEPLIIKESDQRLYKRWFSPTHLKPDDLKKIIGLKIQDYFSFCIVRNPWDRVVSMFKFAVKYKLHKLYDLEEEVTFDDFCEMLKKRCDDPFFIATHKQSQWTKGEYPPQKILRFENLQAEFSEMIKEINLVTVGSNLPHINKTNHKHYSHYYNLNTKKIISEIFAEDIKNFNYKFEEDLGEKEKITNGLKI